MYTLAPTTRIHKRVHKHTRTHTLARTVTEIQLDVSVNEIYTKAYILIHVLYIQRTDTNSLTHAYYKCTLSCCLAHTLTFTNKQRRKTEQPTAYPNGLILYFRVDGVRVCSQTHTVCRRPGTHSHVTFEFSSMKHTLCSYTHTQTQVCVYASMCATVCKYDELRMYVRRKCMHRVSNLNNNYTYQSRLINKAANTSIRIHNNTRALALWMRSCACVAHSETHTLKRLS